MKEAKVKVKKEKKYSAAKNLLGIIFSLLFAGAVFVGLIYLNNYVCDDIIYTNVIVAKADIPGNTQITEENAGDYFMVDTRDITKIPTTCITSLDDYMGKYIVADIGAKDIITPTDFKEYTTEDWKNPVELSLPLDDVGYTLCGTIRAGDVINITILSDANDGSTQSTYLLQGIVVRGAYDSNKNLITAEDDYNARKSGSDLAVASYITFYLDDTEELELQTKVYNAKSIRISREIK